MGVSEVSAPTAGKLTVVPTPIGNLGDITPRALDAFRSADLVVCEDTRVTGQLLKHFDIQKTMASFHNQNEHGRVESFVTQMLAGAHLALCSDAGMPGISDPGFILIRAAIQTEIPVETLPGASALLTALVQSGLPSDRFYFEGFLPHVKGRQSRLGFIAAMPCTVVLYESPHRIQKAVQQLLDLCGPERQIAVSRELTKKFEETIRGPLAQVNERIQAKTPKGEYVIVLAGAA
jgi:16S rRNA (cytidine1402-2'-O)-methyltransferase